MKGIFTHRSHTSLSTSACYENPMKDGGTQSYVAEKFSAWITSAPDSTMSYDSPVGEVNMIEEVPRYKTIIPPDRDLDELWDLGPEQWGQPILTSTNIIGVDRWGQEEDRIGYQVFIWSWFQLFETNALTEDGKVGGRLLNVASHALGEPGNKTRVITKCEAALSVFLRPFARTLKDVLANDPS